MGKINMLFTHPSQVLEKKADMFSTSTKKGNAVSGLCNWNDQQLCLRLWQTMRILLARIHPSQYPERRVCDLKRKRNTQYVTQAPIQIAPMAVS